MAAGTILLHIFEEVAHACEYKYKWRLAFSDWWLSLGRPGSLRLSVHMFMIGPIRKTRCLGQHCGPPRDDFATNAYALLRAFPNNMTILLSTFTTRNFHKRMPRTAESRSPASADVCWRMLTYADVCLGLRNLHRRHAVCKKPEKAHMQHRLFPTLHCANQSHIHVCVCLY